MDLGYRFNDTLNLGAAGRKRRYGDPPNLLEKG